MPTRKKTAAPAVVEAPAPEATAEPWHPWDLDGEDSSADQEPPEATETLEELMAEVGDLDPMEVVRQAVDDSVLSDDAVNADVIAPPGLAMRHDMGWGEVQAQPPPEPPQPDPPPEPRGPISLLIAPGPDRCGAVVSLDAPDLDFGEWLEAKFRMLDNWVFTPEGGDPTRVDDDQLELLALTPIRFLFHGKIGVLVRETLSSDDTYKGQTLCIVPHAFSLAGVGVNSPNGYVEVRALDGEVPVLEVRGGFAPAAS